MYPMAELPYVLRLYQAAFYELGRTGDGGDGRLQLMGDV